MEYLILLLVALTSAQDQDSKLKFEITNNVNADLFIPKNEIEEQHIYAAYLEDTVLPASQKTDLWLKERQFEFSKFTDELNPNARFRYVKFSIYRKYDTPHAEKLELMYMTMYWHHEQPDYDNHRSCLMTSARPNDMKATLEVENDVWDCMEFIYPENNTIVQIDINEMYTKRNKKLLAPFSPRALEEPGDLIDVTFFNERSIDITIEFAAGNFCVDKGTFRTKTHIKAKGKASKFAYNNCGWGSPTKNFTMYLLIKEHDAGIHGDWGVMLVQVVYFQNTEGIMVRECRVTSGAIRTVKHHEVPLVWSADVINCQNYPDTYYDLFHVHIFREGKDQ